MHIAIVAGARPNFMKVMPLTKELKKRNIAFSLINTGQHFDTNMAGTFFEEFDLTPDVSLSPARDNAEQMLRDIETGLTNIFQKISPSLVVVVGDVNSTVIGARVANTLQIPLAHIEAGLRSYNDLMPEEHNRVETDKRSDFLFVTTEEGVENLAKEGITEHVYMVGNVMIDTLKEFEPDIKTTDEKFYFCTLHRGENVDNKERFTSMLDALEIIAQDAKVYLPLHPRTKKRAEEFGLMSKLQSIFELLEPLSYSQSLFYQKNAELVLTDSGGIQEETSYLGTPCLTLRTETERPITVTMGTNTIAGVSKEGILAAYKSKAREHVPTDIPLWDGKASERIADLIETVCAA